MGQGECEETYREWFGTFFAPSFCVYERDIDATVLYPGDADDLTGTRGVFLNPFESLARVNLLHLPLADLCALGVDCPDSVADVEDTSVNTAEVEHTDVGITFNLDCQHREWLCAIEVCGRGNVREDEAEEGSHVSAGGYEVHG